ncbi:MAG: hypothetical protein ACI4EA_04845 [Candidatus Ornithomonoglobus sp.]
MKRKFISCFAAVAAAVTMLAGISAQADYSVDSETGAQTWNFENVTWASSTAGTGTYYFDGKSFETTASDDAVWKFTCTISHKDEGVYTGDSAGIFGIRYKLSGSSGSYFEYTPLVDGKLSVNGYYIQITGGKDTVSYSGSTEFSTIEYSCQAGTTYKISANTNYARIKSMTYTPNVTSSVNDQKQFDAADETDKAVTAVKLNVTTNAAVKGLDVTYDGTTKTIDTEIAQGNTVIIGAIVPGTITADNSTFAVNGIAATPVE